MSHKAYYLCTTALALIIVAAFLMPLSNNGGSKAPKGVSAPLDKSIKLAKDYLLSFNENNMGMAYDALAAPFMLNYTSIENIGNTWISSFVLDALYSMTSKDSTTLEKIDELSNFLLRVEKSDGTWAYDSHVGKDADTTLTVAIVLMRTGQLDPSMTRITLLNDFKSGCGFKSFEGDMGHPNYGAHNEVTSNAIYFLSELGNPDDGQFINCSKKALERELSSEGYWPGYWYPSKYFTTYRALRAFHKSVSSINEKKTLDFILYSQNADGGWGTPNSTAFDTSYALLSLLMYANNGTQIEQGAKYLLKNQNPNGSWNGTTLFYYYLEDCHDANCRIIAHDAGKGIVSTSVALLALNEYSKNQAIVF